MEIAIIDYEMSNLFSVQAACEKVGLSSIITSDKSQILDAKVAILPGVGAFAEAMKYLKNKKLDDAIFQFIDTGKPFIGICLGLQLLFEKSEEFGETNGLGIVKGEVKKFQLDYNKSIKYPVPQIGWNKITKNKTSWEDSLFCNNKNNDFMYFVHSYYVKPEDPSIILSTTKYGNIEYCSSIKQNNIIAFQFHPEKSGVVGLNIYKTLKKEFC